MKTGYSLLLGEYITADQVRYGDTAGFQIVCPCCKDAVFKTERLGAEDVIEYLSHYPGKLDVETCELRVASISTKSQMERNSTARGQSLKVFLSTLRDAVSLRWKDNDRHPEIWADIEKGFGFAQLCKYWENRMQAGSWLSAESVERQLDRATTDVDMQALREQGGLALSFRRRLAKDIVEHLRSPHAGRNRKFIVQAAIKDTFYILYGVEGRPRVEETVRLLWDLCFATDPIAWNSLAGLISNRAAPECAIFHKLDDLTQQSAVRMLVSLPAVEMLRNHRQGRPPLEGVERLDFLPYEQEAVQQYLDSHPSGKGPGA